jgi:phosphoserine phosphatase
MMRNQIAVVVLDLDGVLFDGPSAAYPLAKQLGLEQAFLGVIKRQLSLKDSIIEGSKIWAGVPTDGTLDPLVERIPLMTGAEDTVMSLKSSGYTVGCVSSGVSQFFMKPFALRLGLDFAFSNILGEKDGKHDGTVQYVMQGPQKAEKVLQYLKTKKLSSRKLASVGDGENDLELFRSSSFSIAFNPQTERVSRAASVTIRSKDLRTILPYLKKD